MVGKAPTRWHMKDSSDKKLAREGLVVGDVSFDG